MRLIILFGIVSLFGDITYEGAKSISGQYLALLGANGFIVGAIAGFGELIGYGFRVFSGYLSDKSKKYWPLVFCGYTLNLIAVPLLALAGSWQVAAILLIIERLGKAIRTAPRDALLSYASNQTGRGFGFGLHEALDRIGAVTGPLMLATLLYFHKSYQVAFAILSIPALAALITLAYARIQYPNPQEMEKEDVPHTSKHLSKQFWVYVAIFSCIAAGYIDFPLIAFHLKKSSIVSDVWIPFIFAIAMAAAGVAALIVGKFYDRKGIRILIYTSYITPLFAPLVFFGEFYFILVGMFLWGIGLGVQQSVMRAVVADLVEKTRRGTAYGLMNLFFGVFWFFGSALMGFLYDMSLVSMVIFSITMQLIPLPFLLVIRPSRAR